MLTHVQRVEFEKEELDGKLVKLKAFLISNYYQGLSEEMKLLLTEQAKVMEQYSDILAKRLTLFGAQRIL